MRSENYAGRFVYKYFDLGGHLSVSLILSIIHFFVAYIGRKPDYTN